MANLTDDHIKAVFDLFDADGSGFVHSEDLGLAFQALGFGKQTHEEVDALTAEVVLDGNHHIELPEFRKLVKDHMAVRDSPEEAAKAFRLFDKSQRGSLVSADFIGVYRDVGLLSAEEDDQPYRKVVHEIFRETHMAFPQSGAQPDVQTIQMQQWQKVMQSAVTDKRRRIDESAFSLKTRARVAKKGPFGVKVEAGKTYYWCSCGLSKTQPFCDGSHSAFNRDHGTAFAPVKYVADEARTVWFCGCKQTKSAPFCDGSHTSL
jgi:Ca2+-binding EF-hand superfamily protein/CDGSH-type Zn-finger protein